MKASIKILLTTTLAIILLLGFVMPANPPTGNWYQQFMPNPMGGQLRDITFVDSLTGFAVSDSCILKTTNGGDNWTVKLYGYYIFKRIQFINGSTGFTCAGNINLLRTTNAGNNWVSINHPIEDFDDMAVLNNDTIWLASSEPLAGGVFRTTNGGVNWTQQFSGGINNPNKIYMFNARIGFFSNITPNIYKTTNSGAN